MKYLLSVMSSFFVLVFLLLSPKIANAQIVVNEINPSEEWVELFNTGTSDSSLESCFLYLHPGSSTQKLSFVASDTVGPSQYKIVEKSIHPDWTTDFLNNSGDEVNLQCPTGSDVKAYGNDVDTKSYGRYPNGTGPFYVLEKTKGATNTEPVPSPTPTSTPSPSPAPSPSPSVSPSPSPSPSLSPSPSISPKPSLKPSLRPSPSPQRSPKVELSSEEPAGGQILGVGTNPSPSPGVQVAGDKKFPLSAIVFIAGGLTLVGLALYMFFKNYQNEYNDKEDNPPIE